MMRPMKLAGSELVFGEGCLEYIKSLKSKRTMIITGGTIMDDNGIMQKIQNYLKDIGAESEVFRDVESDPSIKTVLAGADLMKKFKPDLIIAVGGGSPMDAAKAMWIYYEHPELKTLDEILPPNPFPKLRDKARFCCIPSTAGTASEVSRSVVISDNETGLKHGLGNMEMMPDIAICDPEVTKSMPKNITAETGMDALTHALEALLSNRANYVSDILALKAVSDIIETLPKAYEDGKNLKYREIMQNASMVAGIAFTNVSLGIVHSMAHTLGGVFHIPHGLANSILLPFIIEFNCSDEKAKNIYKKIADSLGKNDMAEVIRDLNRKLNIPKSLKEIITDKEKFDNKIEEMAQLALEDGCTKTNPIIPTKEQLIELFKKAYCG